MEYTHFLPALRALGHEVHFFDSLARDAHADFAALNRALLKSTEELQPDVVFTVLLLAEVWLETVALLRRAGCKVVNWSTDDSWKYREFARLIAADFDLFATTFPDALPWYAADGIGNVFLTQWAASADWLAEPRPARDCRYPVSFIGSAYGSRAERIARLGAAGVVVECFGHGWPNGAVAAERIAQIMRDSMVSLNFSEGSAGGPAQIKARVFEVPAAGGMLLTEAAPHLQDYLVPGNEAVLFQDDADLAAQARQLLEDPDRRDAIACAGHARVARQHTYEQRLRALLQRVGAVASGPRDIDWPEFERHSRAHIPGPGLRLLRWLLVTPCVLVWGRTRGRRAARRILFELSWRLVGRRTYTAAGWSGRLFYRES
ncbi:MAG TPA: glycosyltransferase [Burkholderiales bacterium]|nr:glycosyltransferase [Burkholderiales bacterium]